jgi:hypothetical protein
LKNRPENDFEFIRTAISSRPFGRGNLSRSAAVNFCQLTSNNFSLDEPCPGFSSKRKLLIALWLLATNEKGAQDAHLPVNT